LTLWNGVIHIFGETINTMMDVVEAQGKRVGREAISELEMASYTLKKIDFSKIRKPKMDT